MGPESVSSQQAPARCRNTSELSDTSSAGGAIEGCPQTPTDFLAYMTDEEVVQWSLVLAYCRSLRRSR